jgi:hypothetical protein
MKKVYVCFQARDRAQKSAIVSTRRENGDEVYNGYMFEIRATGQLYILGDFTYLLSRRDRASYDVLSKISVDKTSLKVNVVEGREGKLVEKI